ncbi:toprim domain-containing protein [Isosphaeraceae bacterium EP7]
MSPGTIRKAGLGWTPGVRLPTRDGRTYVASGIVIPWWAGGRLALVKLRQPDGRTPKYAEAYRDRPSLYPRPETVHVGRPLAIAEGELDALLLGQDLGDLASVVTLGSASASRTAEAQGRMLTASRWYVATDADDAGDRASEGWPARARRARPPSPFNDWTEAKQAGVNLARWWADRLAGVETPPTFAWEELAALRWGPSFDDPSPGIVVE